MNRCKFPLRGILLVSKTLNMITIDITSIDIALHDIEIEKKNTQISSQTQTFQIKYDRNTHVKYNPCFCNLSHDLSGYL